MPEERLLESESINQSTLGRHISAEQSGDEDSAQRWCEKQGIIIGIGITQDCTHSKQPGFFAIQITSRLATSQESMGQKGYPC